MINSLILKLEGGLGNQFYQYAAALSFSKKYKVPLFVAERLDSPLDRRRHNHLGLFSCNYSLATNFQKMILYLSFVKRFSVGKFTRKYLYQIFSFSIISDPESGFFPDILKNKSGYVILRGYWQSYKYFDSIREELIHKLSLSQPALNPRNIDLLNLITSVNSVAIHVRRGDYENIPFFKENFGLCSLDYYSNGVHYFSKNVVNPHYFVFSDDPDWVASNLKIDGPVYFVNHNIGQDYEDFRLMKSCKHFIIANSSFSWWAAYLGQYPGKIVVTPSRWFVNDPMPFEDRIPDTWVKLDS